MDNTFNHAQLLKTLPHKPGVYRMLDQKGQILYVGKARDLKKRVSSYFQKTVTSVKTHSMVSQIQAVEVTVTHSEGEALLLENNLIKEFKPRYNILLRDDKSYPYIYLSNEDEFPRLSFHRGARKGKGKHFGPYPSAGAVRETLNLLQKVFCVRQCEDSFYRNRSRPCLQYQIKRCTAPCVGLVNQEQYGEDVRHAEMFLEGKSDAVINELVEKMEAASQDLQFERAAKYRDQIVSLRRIQEKQYVSGESGDIDVIAAVVKNGVGCVQVFFIRGGLNLGNKTYFPKQTADATSEDILDAFIPQFYLSGRGNRIVPNEIITNGEVTDSEVLTQILGEQAGHKVAISPRVRGERARWVDLAESNARAALTAHLSSKANVLKRFELLQDALGLDDMPQRMECFDISHTFGEAPVASCVVMDTGGPVKSDYRKFNIEGVTPGDDYGAMRQALLRRYTRLKKGEGKIPDILFIDGGKGQVSEAEKVLEELQINGLTLIGVAKGSERKPGLETLILSGQAQPVHLSDASPALHLIQQIRDEAHRFAISAHRQRRSKARQSSVLEEIPGLGPKRRQLILKQFGGLQQVYRAGVEDLAKLPGISGQLAQKIYDTLHPEE
jgi:excinuclease ABC subunit C